MIRIMDTLHLLKLCLLFSLIGSSLTKYCTISYSCGNTCYQLAHKQNKCGFLWASRCSTYYATSHSCYRTCYKLECCPGYTGYDCGSRVCYGDFYCLNGGTCMSRNRCHCRTGYGGEHCEKEMCRRASYCLNGGSCNSLDKCVCLDRFQGPRCEEKVPTSTAIAIATVSEEKSDSNTVIISVISSSVVIVAVIVLAVVVAICIFRKLRKRDQQNENMNKNIADMLATLKQGIPMSVFLTAGFRGNYPVLDNQRAIGSNRANIAIDY